MRAQVYRSKLQGYKMGTKVHLLHKVEELQLPGSASYGKAFCLE